MHTTPWSARASGGQLDTASGPPRPYSRAWVRMARADLRSLSSTRGFDSQRPRLDPSPSVAGPLLTCLVGPVCRGRRAPHRRTAACPAPTALVASRRHRLMQTVASALGVALHR